MPPRFEPIEQDDDDLAEAAAIEFARLEQQRTPQT